MFAAGAAGAQVRSCPDCRGRELHFDFGRPEVGGWAASRSRGPDGLFRAVRGCARRAFPATLCLRGPLSLRTSS